MDDIKKILPFLWECVTKKDCAINVSTQDNELTVNIIERKRKKCFKSADSAVLISNLTQYMQA